MTDFAINCGVAASGIKVAENPIQAWLREGRVVLERVVLPIGMIVHEELEVLAHDKSMKEFLVDDSELRHAIVLPRIMDVECQVNGFCGSGALGATVSVIWYSAGSGMSVASFMPQRGQCLDPGNGCPYPWDRPIPAGSKDPELWGLDSAQ
jgi:hypothetical protein